MCRLERTLFRYNPAVGEHAHAGHSGCGIVDADSGLAFILSHRMSRMGGFPYCR